MKLVAFCVSILMILEISSAQSVIQTDVSYYKSYLQSQISAFSTNAVSILDSQVKTYYKQYTDMRNLITNSVAQSGSKGTSSVNPVIITLDNNIDQLQTQFSVGSLNSAFHDFQQRVLAQFFLPLSNYATQLDFVERLKPAAMTCWSSNTNKISDAHQKLIAGFFNVLQKENDKLTQAAHAIQIQVEGIMKNITTNVQQCQATFSLNDCILKYVSLLVTFMKVTFVN